MTTSTEATNNVWKAIDEERRRDCVLKRVSIAAWSATVLFVAVLILIGAVSAAQMVRAAMAGAAPWATVLGTVIPVIIPLAMLTVLIAVLSTVAMFLRMRSASLHEIQLRLAALEDVLVRERQSGGAQ